MRGRVCWTKPKNRIRVVRPARLQSPRGSRGIASHAVARHEGLFEALRSKRALIAPSTVSEAHALSDPLATLADDALMDEAAQPFRVNAEFYKHFFGVLSVIRARSRGRQSLALKPSG